MIYKFDNRLTTETNTSLELSTENEYLKIDTQNNEEELLWNTVYLKSEDIDDMIVALTNLKNEISEWRRNQLKK
jgi:hypothetical protein